MLLYRYGYSSSTSLPILPHVEVSYNRGIPSHHPFRTMGCSTLHQPFWRYPHGYGKPHGSSPGDEAIRHHTTDLQQGRVQEIQIHAPPGRGFGRPPVVGPSGTSMGSKRRSLEDNLQLGLYVASISKYIRCILL